MDNDHQVLLINGNGSCAILKDIKENLAAENVFKISYYFPTPHEFSLHTWKLCQGSEMEKNGCFSSLLSTGVTHPLFFLSLSRPCFDPH